MPTIAVFERFPHDLLANYIRAIDDLVTDEAARYVESDGPDLSWVYLEYTDSVGHGYGDGPELTAAVQHMDGQIGKIWSSVQKRQQAYDEDWIIIITTDHGRDAKTGHGQCLFAGRLFCQKINGLGHGDFGTPSSVYATRILQSGR